MDKDFEKMSPEERKNDADWQKMTPVERLYAMGAVSDRDGNKITLQEYRDGTADERVRKINERKREERRIQRECADKKLAEMLKNKGLRLNK
jgi:hypothetical protein